MVHNSCLLELHKHCAGTRVQCRLDTGTWSRSLVHLAGGRSVILYHCCSEIPPKVIHWIIIKSGARETVAAIEINLGWPHFPSSLLLGFYTHGMNKTLKQKQFHDIS